MLSGSTFICQMEDDSINMIYKVTATLKDNLRIKCQLCMLLGSMFI